MSEPILCQLSKEGQIPIPNETVGPGGEQLAWGATSQLTLAGTIRQAPKQKWRRACLGSRPGMMRPLLPNEPYRQQPDQP